VELDRVLLRHRRDARYARTYRAPKVRTAYATQKEAHVEARRCPCQGVPIEPARRKGQDRVKQRRRETTAEIRQHEIRFLSHHVKFFFCLA